MENPSQSYGASSANDCRVGSHSVACHPTLVNAPHLNPSQAGWYSINLPRSAEGWKAELTLVLVIYLDGLLVL